MQISAVVDYDVEAVKAQVDTILASQGVEDARKHFEETLSSWADEYSRILEEASQPLSVADRQPYEESLVDLWLAYAAFERRLRQWKQAVKVFESATTDVIGEKTSRLWVEYGRFCRERGKFANAQKVYLRAVEVLDTKAERDMIWSEFLEALKAKGGPGTDGIETVAQLKAMLGIPEEEEQKHEIKGVDEVSAESGPGDPSSDASSDPVSGSIIRGMEKPASGNNLPDNAVNDAPVFSEPSVLESSPDGKRETLTLGSQMQMVPAQSTAPELVDASAAKIAPAQPAETEPPPLLFSTEALLNMDDAYGAGLEEETLGAVKVLLGDPAVLDVVEGQWLVQAMKQQLASTILAGLEAKHTEARERLALRHAQLQASIPSVSLSSQLEQERQALATACERERAQLRTQLSAEFWQVLEAQQSILGEGAGGAGLPGLEITRDRTAIAKQQKVLRVVTANMQLYHFHRKRQRMTEDLAHQTDLLHELQCAASGVESESGKSTATRAETSKPSSSSAPDAPSPDSLPSGERSNGSSRSKRGTSSGTRWEPVASVEKTVEEGKGGQSEGGRPRKQMRARGDRGHSPHVESAKVGRSPPRRSSRRGGHGSAYRDGAESKEKATSAPSADNRAILRRMMEHFK